MSALQAALLEVTQRHDLTEAQMTGAMEEIASGSASPLHVAAFLAALRTKGETAAEVAAAAAVMRAHALSVDAGACNLVDTCGTGGDGAGTFNISTTAALVAAAAGASVAKHGNRSATSRCSSADLLEALGIALGDGDVFLRCLRGAGVGFLFAPHHHAAFKAVAPTRAELGLRTIFNLIGPLANPARARRQVVGVAAPEQLAVLAGALAGLGAEHALVVHGDGTDEIGVSGPTTVYEVRGGEVTSYQLESGDIGLGRWSRDELRGGDAVRNAEITRGVLSGEMGARRDAVLANAGAALYVAAVAATIAEGVRMAAEAIDSGRASTTLATVAALSVGEG